VYRIEQSFGGLKKHFGWDRSIYMGLKKKSDYLIFEVIAFNLKRSIKVLRAWERRDMSKFWVESKKMMGKRVWKGGKVKSWREKGISTDRLKINPSIRTLISSLIIIYSLKLIFIVVLPCKLRMASSLIEWVRIIDKF
jgi:hypothetical protein